MNGKQIVLAKGTLIGLSVFLGAAALGGGGYLLYRAAQGGTSPISSVSTPTATLGQSVIVTSTTTPTVTVDGNGIATFQGLGIQFQYNTYDSGLKLHLGVKVVGNKILFGDINNLDASTYRIEVYQKDPSISLKDAVAQQFLQGYSSRDCPLLDATYQPSSQYPQGAENVRISWSVDPAKCPVSYVTDENGRSFTMDYGHKGQFIFMEAGQSPLGVFNGSQDWVSTLSFQ